MSDWFGRGVWAARRMDWIAAALGLAVLALDARTLAPSVLWSDEGEFQFQIATLGVPHQTGYPLYILGGKLWTLLVPIGDIAYRVNLLSAAAGAATIVLVYFAVKRLIQGSRAAAPGVDGAPLAALMSAAALAAAPAFWQQSSIAGVRTLHTAFVALITLLSVGVLQGWASLQALALALGFSFAHHRMTLLLLPGLAWVVAQRLAVEAGLMSKGAIARRLAVLAVLVVLPQVLYAYVWLRGEWGSVDEFARFVLATNEVPIVLGKSQAEIARQFTAQVFPSVWRALTPVGLLVALIGLAALFARHPELRIRRAMGVYLAVGIALNVIFAGIHFTEDPNKYLTHGFVLLAVALGAGWGELAARLAGGRRAAGLALAAVGLALPLASGIEAFSMADQSGLGWIGPLTLDRMAGIESGSTILADWSFVWPMLYQQAVDGHRRDLIILRRSDSTQGQAEAMVQSGRPLYAVNRTVIRAWKGAYPTLAAPNGLLRVLPRPPELGPVQALHEPIGRALVLTGLATWPAQLTSNQLALLRFHWQIVNPPGYALSSSVRLVDGEGQVWQQRDVELDVADYVDVVFFLEPTLPAGRYHWQVIVDDPLTRHAVGQADLPPFEIGRPVQPASPDSVIVAERPGAPLRSGGWLLLGANPTAVEIAPGAPLLVPLFWHKVAFQTSETPARVELISPGRGVVADAAVRLPAGALIGDLVETRPVVEMPRDLAGGDYQVCVVGDARVCVGALRVRDRPHVYRLPAAAQPRAVRLGDRIELAGYTLVPYAILPGEMVRLTLYWRALDKGVKSYKVFVHVIGAEGQLLAQQDGVPVGWTIPTDTWVKDEIIADEYSLPISPDARPGVYTLGVGMYDPDTGERLPAVQDGQPLADNVIKLAQLDIK